jgi:hypothetical protein
VELTAVVNMNRGGENPATILDAPAEGIVVDLTGPGGRPNRVEVLAEGGKTSSAMYLPTID